MLPRHTNAALANTRRPQGLRSCGGGRAGAPCALANPCTAATPRHAGSGGPMRCGHLRACADSGWPMGCGDPPKRSLPTAGCGDPMRPGDALGGGPCIGGRRPQRARSGARARERRVVRGGGSRGNAAPSCPPRRSCTRCPCRPSRSGASTRRTGPSHPPRWGGSRNWAAPWRARGGRAAWRAGGLAGGSRARASGCAMTEAVGGRALGAGGSGDVGAAGGLVGDGGAAGGSAWRSVALVLVRSILYRHDTNCALCECCAGTDLYYTHGALALY